MIDEARTEMKLPQKWRQRTKHLPSFRPIPLTGMMFRKEKSREWEGLLQMRLVICHFKHPSGNEGHLVGRCLSVIIAARSDMPNNLEIWNMQGSRDIFMRACDASAQGTHEWCGADLHMVNMYKEVPTEHVLRAVAYDMKCMEARTRSHRPSRDSPSQGEVSRRTGLALQPVHIL